MTALYSSVPRIPVRPPRVILVEPSAGVQTLVTAALLIRDCHVGVAHGLPDELGDVDLVLVEADRGSRTISLVKRIHAQRPALPIVAVLPWWNDDERDVLGFVRYVLHVPMREDGLRELAELAKSAQSSDSCARFAGVRDEDKTVLMH